MNNANLRLQAQKEYVAELQRQHTTKLVAQANTPELNQTAKSIVGCFVVPVFTDNGEQTDVVIRESITPTLSLVLVMSVTGMGDTTKPRYIGALVFAPNSFLTTKYAAGVNIGGRIAIKYSFGKGHERDIMYGIGTKIPCLNVDGQVIYRKQIWSPFHDEQDDPTPLIANLEEIRTSQLLNQSKATFEKGRVIVLGNAKGGCAEQGLTEDPDELTITVKQGNRYAALVGDFELIGEMALEAGDELKGGRIIVKEQLEPLDPDNPEFLVKKKKGKICRKGGKVIYSHSYFTYNRKDFDEIIDED